MHVETIPSSSPDFPESLKELARPVEQLWTLGDQSLLQLPLVAIVGTRRATSYGERITRAVAGALARAGACVVSGMALGIDATAHRAALDADGKTIAVLGNGADVAYPKSHSRLHDEIIARGLVISEMPPGAQSHRASFILRNRIIAAISKIVIVVEAPYESGALSTVKSAMELGRDIGVVLGNIDSPQSAGSNKLVRDGAYPITDVDDALVFAGFAPRGAPSSQPTDPLQLRVWTALGDGDASLDELCARTALPVAECMIAVSGLELRGSVECALTGEIRRR